MKKNNKLSRKRAAVLAAKQSEQNQEVAGTLLDGTEVLKSRESRAKVRRWSFEADVVLNLPGGKNEDGTDKPAISTASRTIKLDAISYSTVKEAKEDCKTHEHYLRGSNRLFAMAEIKVRAVPHETVSNATINQISGYRDMSMILDRALGMAITEAQDVVTGKAVGSQFVEKPAVEANEEKGIQAESAVTLATLKENFYKRALDEIKKNLEKQNGGETPSETVPSGSVEGSPETDVVVTDAEESERKPFVPEIVEVGKSNQAVDGVEL